MSATADGLRAWAHGTYAGEAGVELLIRSFGGRFAEQGCPWVRPCRRPGWFWVDAEAIAEQAGGLSGGERRVLVVVAALVDARPVDDLADILAGVDRTHLVLILAAMAHAGGSHEQVAVVRHGESVSFDRLPAVVPWPAEARRAA